MSAFAGFRVLCLNSHAFLFSCVSVFLLLLSPGVTTITPRDLKALLGRCRSKHRPRAVFCRRRVRLRHFRSPPSSVFAVSPSLSNCEWTASNTVSPLPVLSLVLRVSALCVCGVFRSFVHCFGPVSVGLCPVLTCVCECVCLCVLRNS